MGKRTYYVVVEDYELDNVEKIVYERIVGQLQEEIRQFAKETAISVLSGKPITKEKWYKPAFTKGDTEEKL